MKIKPFLKVPIDLSQVMNPNFGAPIPARKRRPQNGRFQGNMKKASIKAGYLRSHRVAPASTKGLTLTVVTYGKAVRGTWKAA